MKLREDLEDMDIQELAESRGYSEVDILEYYDEPIIIKCSDEFGDECILMLVSHTSGKMDEKYIKFRPNSDDLSKYLNREMDLLTLINRSDNYYIIYGKSINKVDEIPNRYLPDEGFYNNSL